MYPPVNLRVGYRPLRYLRVGYRPLRYLRVRDVHHCWYLWVRDVHHCWCFFGRMSHNEAQRGVFLLLFVRGNNDAQSAPPCSNLSV